MDCSQALPKLPRPIATTPNTTLVLPHPDPTCREITFSPEDIARIRDPCAWLNDDCVNGCAQLLALHFGMTNVDGGHPTINSSFAMAQQRDGQSLDDGVWRVNHRTRYWESDVWIIPIHQPRAHHWELAVVYLKERQIAYFDSFANESSWEVDVQVSGGR